MAFASKFTRMGSVLLFCTSLAFLLLFCSVFLQENSDCATGYECYYVQVEMQSRKLLNEKEVVVKSDLHASSGELRMVPSGPDPLHHNNNPKKPRTP